MSDQEIVFGTPEHIAGLSRKALEEDFRWMQDRCTELEVECERMASENAKLREIARRFGEYVSQDRCEGCVMKRRCNDGDVEECWLMTEIRALANELGIEVPQ